MALGFNKKLPKEKQTNLLVAGMLVIALALRLAVFFCAYEDPDRFSDPDSSAYLLAGKEFLSVYMHTHPENLPLSLDRTPLYPLFFFLIISIFHSINAVIVFQILVGVINVFLSYKIYQLLLNKTAVLCLILMAVDPISILYSNLILTETLFTLFLCLGMYYWLKAKNQIPTAVGSGLFFGLSALTRPILLYFPIVFIPLQAFYKKLNVRKKTFIFFLLFFLLPVAGWIARNYVITGSFIFSTAQGHNMLSFRAAGVIAEIKQIPFEEAKIYLEEKTKEKIPPGSNEAESGKIYSRVGLGILLRYPLQTVKTSVKGFFQLLFGPGKSPLEKLVFGNTAGSGSGILFQALFGYEFLYLFILYAGISAFLFFLFRNGQAPVFWPIITLLLYLLIISSSTGANSRFRVPISPFLSICSSAGYSYLLDRFKPKGKMGKAFIG